MASSFVGMSLWSEDLNNLLPFYRDTLGLKVTMESPDYVVLGGEGEGAPWLGLGTHSEVHGLNNDAARHMVGISCTDIQGEVQRLKAAGVEFIQEPTDYGDLWIATLKDPENNLVQLFEFHSS
jgi:predicted enzyme related to lactoylglutathione lyase